MDFAGILTVSVICFVVGTLSISTGGTSLITVPVLIWLGMAPKSAIATNMFALVFFSISGAIGFRRKSNGVCFKMVAFFSLLTICGSVIGARLVPVINEDILKIAIAFMMCVIAGMLFLKKDLGLEAGKGQISKFKLFTGALLIFVLGIYGGLYSGGYVTLLSYVLILNFGFDFLQTAFITKVFNVFSSTAACVLFYYYGLIDFFVAIPLAVSMSLGGVLGARIAIAKGNEWVRRVFIFAVIALAIKLLAF